MKELSFVILTWNSERYIAGCLTALRNALATFGAAYEVFIVDNGSQDGTVALLETFRQQQPEQTGAPAGRSTGRRERLRPHVAVNCTIRVNTALNVTKISNFGGRLPTRTPSGAGVRPDFSHRRDLGKSLTSGAP